MPSQWNIRERKCIEAYNEFKGTRYVQVRGKIWDAVDLDTGNRVSIKTSQVDRKSFVIDPRDVAEPLDFLFGLFDFTRNVDYIQESIEEWLFIPKELLEGFRAEVKARSYDMWAKNRINTRVGMTLREILDLCDYRKKAIEMAPPRRMMA
jgi:hypothetical protein